MFFQVQIDGANRFIFFDFSEILELKIEFYAHLCTNTAREELLDIILLSNIHINSSDGLNRCNIVKYDSSPNLSFQTHFFEILKHFFTQNVIFCMYMYKGSSKSQKSLQKRPKMSLNAQNWSEHVFLSA